MKELNKNYILHFVPYEKFTESIIHFFNSNYNLDKHFFIIWGDKNIFYGDLQSLLLFNNVKEFSQINNSDINTLIKKCEKIVLHQFTFTRLLYIKKRFKRDVYVLFWGGDMEQYKKDNIKTLKRKTAYHLSRCLLKNTIALNLIDEDYEILKNIFKIDFKDHYVARYLNDKFHNQVVNLPYEHNEFTTNILIGNSASRTNNHKEIIDMLAKYAHESAKFYIPLSYGDEDYGNEIELYAKAKLGAKAIIIRDFMSPEEYNIFLNSIDIGVFNYYRQQGLGNIQRLLTMRKKVFLNKRSGMFNFLSNLGIELFDIQAINESTFIEFSNYCVESLERNRELMIEHLSSEVIKSEWDRCLSIN